MVNNTLNKKGNMGRLLWVHTDDLREILDAATWLKPTQYLRRQGWDVTLASAPSAPSPTGRRKIDGVEVLEIKRSRLWLLGQALYHLRLLALILRQRHALDAILFHEMSAGWLLPLRLLGARRPRLLMDTRTLFMANPDGITPREWLRWAYVDLMRRACNHLADGQLCITPAMAEACGIPDDRLWGIWPSGVDPERFALPPGIRTWPERDDPIELIYVGTLQALRNLRGLCEAVRIANAQSPSPPQGTASGAKGTPPSPRFRLTLVGAGPERATLEAIAAESRGTVRVLPPVAHAQVPPLLWRAHVAMLPFPDQENLRVASPIKLFEYMAAGLPVMATRIRCHTDVVGTQEFVFWAEDASPRAMASALNRIWESRCDLQRLGQLAAAKAPTWSWDASAERLSQALSRGLGHASRTRTHPAPNTDNPLRR